MDLDHTFGGDIGFGPTGDLATVSGAAEGEQRVLRRLLTNPFADVWNPDYGAGLGLFVGQAGADSSIRAIALQQMYLEAAVSQSPPPVIAVAPFPDGTVVLSVAYTDADTGTPVSLPPQTLA